MKIFQLGILSIIIFTVAGCDPAFHLYVSNTSNETKIVKVSLSKFYFDRIDSLNFFNSNDKLNWKNYQNAIIKRSIIKDTIYEYYSFNIKPGETTLLQPLTIATPIYYIIIENDTTFFYTNKKVDKEKRFLNAGRFNYIKNIK